MTKSSGRLVFHTLSAGTALARRQQLGSRCSVVFREIRGSRTEQYQRVERRRRAEIYNTGAGTRGTRRPIEPPLATAFAVGGQGPGRIPKRKMSKRLNQFVGIGSLFSKVDKRLAKRRPGEASRQVTARSSSRWRLGAKLAACSMAAAAVSMACGDGSEKSIGKSRDDILNGTPSSAAETQGWVMVTHNNINIACSGTLIRNDMILTARHCVTVDTSIGGTVDTNPANFFITMGTQVQDASRIIAASPSVDVALIQTAAFFSMNGARYDWSRGIYSGTDASLLNSTLLCYGYGANACDGSGALVLRTANLTVSSTTTAYLAYNTNSSNQNFWKGDSGGSCLSGSVMTGVTSTCTCGVSCTQQGPESFRSWVLSNLLGTAAATITTATTSNTSGNTTLINNADANNNPSQNVQVTANWNPVGSSGVYDAHNIGVKYDTTNAKWSVLNKDGAAMPIGASFNVTAGGGTNSFVHNTASSNISGHMSYLDSPLLNGVPSIPFVVTPNESGTPNNHATGIFYDSSVAKWSVYNEDFAPMAVGAKFNIRVVSRGEAYYRHTATTSNTVFSWTYLNQPNLNGQPHAQIFITHIYGDAGFGGIAVNHPLGVFYDTNAGQWAIFTQDGAGMPVGSMYNIVIRP